MLKVILPDDEQAASKRTIEGWVSRGGRFFGVDERTARWDGATHVLCSTCGGVISKGWTLCHDCREAKDIAKYDAMEQRDWNGEQMIYDDARDIYHSTPGDAEDWADDHDIDVANMRLVLCEPVYCPVLDPGDYASDELPGDGELPDEIVEAINAFNAAVGGIVLSWRPGKYALKQKEHAEGCRC